MAAVSSRAVIATTPTMTPTVAGVERGLPVHRVRGWTERVRINFGI